MAAPRKFEGAADAVPQAIEFGPLRAAEARAAGSLFLSNFGHRFPFLTKNPVCAEAFCGDWMELMRRACGESFVAARQGSELAGFLLLTFPEVRLAPALLGGGFGLQLAARALLGRYGFPRGALRLIYRRLAGHAGSEWAPQARTLPHVDAIVVRADCCGHGIGSALLDRARTLAEPRYGGLSLLVEIENAGAIRLYQRFGFRIIESGSRQHLMVWEFPAGRTSAVAGTSQEGGATAVSGSGRQMTGTARQNVYSQIALAHVPRLLGLLDREPQSVSAGSFDREHWGWKFRDFPTMMLQANVLSLALLWRHPLGGSVYFQSAILWDWIVGALRSTMARQHANGAFDSVAPFTQDHGVTLAIVYYLTETARLLDDGLPADLRKDLASSVRRACAFASATDEDYAFISNHHALYALGWHNATELLSDPRLGQRAEAAVDRIIRRQSSEGWYAEYGGPDPGYESLGIHYLALYYGRTRSARLLESLRRSVKFFAHFVHPDGGVGGAYGSRHTSLYFPAGFEILASEIAEAAAVAVFMRERLSHDNVVTPATTDAQNLAPLMNSYLAAALAHRDDLTAAPLPCQRMNGVRHFPESGISVAATPSYYAVANGRKGGVCRIFDRRTAAVAYEDAGYLVTARKRRWISQTLGMGLTEAANANTLDCETTFTLWQQKMPTPHNYLLLRLLGLTLFRHPRIAAWIRNLIIRRLITGARAGPIRLRRHFLFEQDTVVISDQLELARPMEVTEVQRPRHLTGIHMGSAKYFHPSEMVPVAAPSVAHLAAELSRHGRARCSVQVQFSVNGDAALVSNARSKKALESEAALRL